MLPANGRHRRARTPLVTVGLVAAGAGRHRRPRPARALSATAGAVAVGAFAAAAHGGGAATQPPTRTLARVDPPPFTATPLLVPLDLTVHRGGGRILPAATAGSRVAPLTVSADARAIPPRVLAAYVAAAAAADRRVATCGLGWQLLAAIGYVESGDARRGGSLRAGWDGVARPPILGPVLDGGPGFAIVPDTDHGRLDGDPRWDRAVGPMQMLPSTWARYGVDANHDGVANPQDIDDATLAAADYLCAAATGLDQPPGMIRAVYSYNHSFDYVRTVLTIAADYLRVDPPALAIDPLPADPPVPASPAAAPTHVVPSPSPSPTRSATPLPSASPASSPTATPTPTAPPATASAAPATPSVSPSASAT
ncbi:MAG: lytic transglycosylase domain-containing protein [Frankiaceae bacterium]|nr:lytic transglycosylase domain-containing protein [Frankiaceae bacterium]